MSEKEFNDAKNFKYQMGGCAIMCWVATIFVLIIDATKINELFIIPICGVIMSIIYFKMKSLIDKYEKTKD